MGRAAVPHCIAVGEPPLVSVVVACHNYGRFLAAAIGSIEAQTYRPVEIVVVDDGSTDDTAAVCARFPDVRLIQQENSGVSRARNRGIAESRGEYLVFLDADDVLLPDALAAGVRDLLDHPECAFTSGWYSVIGPAGEPRPEPGRWQIPDPGYHALLRRNYLGPPCTTMFRREALVASGGFDPTLDCPLEDYELTLRLAAERPIRSHEAVVAAYRVHGSNISGNPARQLRGTLMLLARHRSRDPNDRRAVQACREGARNARAYYCGQLLEMAIADLRARCYRDAARKLALIARHDRLILARRAASAMGRRLSGAAR